MEFVKEDSGFKIICSQYKMEYKKKKSGFLEIFFGDIGADFFVASGCDSDGYIDELISLKEPVIHKKTDCLKIYFNGKTTLWDKTEYIFYCYPDKILYSYKVNGVGKLDNARFFEGFIKDDPRFNENFYPYFCGPGRHMAYHRPVKEFMTSSIPHFEKVYSFSINSADKRIFNYYEDISIRLNSDRHYFGGDWLASPPPFLYLIGRKDIKSWLSMGLVVPFKQNNFLDYQFKGGEGFGLNLTYDGYTNINGQWESPKIIFQRHSSDVYKALESYVNYLAENNNIHVNKRRNTPSWWKKPIFSGWGEQVYHSNRWSNYYSGKYNDWSEDDTFKFCTQAFYEEMLGKLEKKGINPTILIVDNRWFDNDHHLDVDKELWPDFKGFIKRAHKKNQKVILWVSPFSYCRSAHGKDVPIENHLVFDDNESFTYEIDTDVFYKSISLEKKKAKLKKAFILPGATLTDPNWRFFPDVENPAYENQLRKKINYLLSPQGLDADGFEFDYTHFVPRYRGYNPVEKRESVMWGVEILYKMISIYYDQAKKTKADALIISHTFNPYFDDVVDMLRLQDFYTDRKSIVPQMKHRAEIAKTVCPKCEIHTDQHPMPSLEAWREYAKFQPSIGNPCLYYVTGIETTKEKFTDTDWEMLKKIWEDYNKNIKK